jgi:CBS domain-containing protein
MHIDNLAAYTSSRLTVLNSAATVQDAALSLSRPGIGLVVVCNAGGASEGVLSKSDLVRHLTGPAASKAPVSKLMTRSIISCGPQDDVHDVWQIMAARNLQNVPVIDVGARPLGILDIRDAMKALIEEEQIQEQMLFNDVAGIGYR